MLFRSARPAPALVGGRNPRAGGARRVPGHGLQCPEPVRAPRPDSRNHRRSATQFLRLPRRATPPFLRSGQRRAHRYRWFRRRSNRPAIAAGGQDTGWRGCHCAGTARGLIFSGRQPRRRTIIPPRFAPPIFPPGQGTAGPV